MALVGPGQQVNFPGGDSSQGRTVPDFRGLDGPMFLMEPKIVICDFSPFLGVIPWGNVVDLKTC